VLSQVDESLFWLLAQSHTVEECHSRAALLRSRLKDYSRRSG
jgi:hypothetical protein